MRKRKNTKYIVVHVTATPPKWSGGIKGVTAMHKARGWSRVGYRRLIRRDGTTEYAPGGDDAYSNHVRGFNSVSMGITMEGGVNRYGEPENNMTPAQMEALEANLRELTAKYPRAGVCGHRDLSPDRDGDGIIEPHEHLKACPCFDVIPWADARGIRTANIRGVWDGVSTKRQRAAPRAPDERTVYLQRLLLRSGYEFGGVDGFVGPKTEKAIGRFQAANGLRQTNSFDRPTVARLRDINERSQPVPMSLMSQGATPEVEALIDDTAATNRLSKSDLSTGLVAVTTVGSQAKEAVKTMTDVTEGVPANWLPILVIVAVLGGCAYLWYSRNKKRKLARAADVSFSQSYSRRVDF